MPERDWYEPLPIFVYGTLKTGCRNHGRYCFDATAIEPAWVPGRLYCLPEGFPAMVEGSDGRVHGELLTFPDSKLALRRLDALEGVIVPGEPGEYYLRARIRAQRTNGEGGIEAWCYLFSEERLAESPGAKQIPDGKWRGGR